LRGVDRRLADCLEPAVVTPVADIGLAAVRFARTRWGWRWRDRAALLAWQARQLQRLLRDRLPRAPFYGRAASRLVDLPVVDKETLLAHFDGFNTRGIRQADAMATALAAEHTRNFRPELGDITVGLSSGTSGRRGLFLVSRHERVMWAAMMLARTLSGESLARIASPWRAPLSVAFFLRANSNLYSTLRSQRIAFAFHDLLRPIEMHLAELTASPPHVLVAPATVLRRLAEVHLAGGLPIRPRQIISVAETLEAEDAFVIERAFGRRVQQIYQATEGFLGYTCPAGRLHLNEEGVHIEPEWLDVARTRFHPIVTDFTRQTQLVVRYRLDDVLRLAGGPCPCGRVSLSLSGIDGRRDAVLLLPARRDGAPRAIFPDLVRRAMTIGGEHVRDYRIVQTEDGLLVRLAESERSATAAVRDELLTLLAQQDVIAPPITFAPWQDDAPGDKCCRIRRLTPAPRPAPEVWA
jgi:putative adenylate-forming enzyme